MGLFEDKPTHHRIQRGERLRVVYARTDWEGNFVRYIVKRTKGEIRAAKASYAPAQVGVLGWFEVHEHEFRSEKV